MASTKCPECNQIVTIMDGAIAQHQKPGSREKCSGSGQAPQED